MYLSLNTFQYFPNSLAKLNIICVIGCANWRATNVLLSLDLRCWLTNRRWVSTAKPAISRRTRRQSIAPQRLVEAQRKGAD
jgi:hypothetical protein